MFLKWLFDRIVAFFGLLFLWPVILVTAILVKVKMPGIPIWLYRGEQGYHAKWFRYFCYAFYPVHLLILGLIKILM